MSAELRDLAPELRTHPHIAHALKLWSSWQLGNYCQFFRYYKSAPGSGRSLLELFISRERLSALKMILKAYVLYSKAEGVSVRVVCVCVYVCVSACVCCACACRVYVCVRARACSVCVWFDERVNGRKQKRDRVSLLAGATCNMVTANITLLSEEDNAYVYLCSAQWLSH